MKIAIYIILGIIWFLWIGKFQIKLSPLRFELPEWKLAIAWLVLSVGLVAVLTLENRKTYERGFNDCKQVVIDLVDSFKKADTTLPLNK
jgi:hypothetical protein